MARYGRSGQRLTEEHEKSMWRYAEHARDTSAQLARLFYDEAEASGIDVDKFRRWFEQCDAQARMDYESANARIIAAFVKKTPSQWPGALRKLFKGERYEQKLWFMVAAMTACRRVAVLVELRDEFRNSLAPGGGYRITTAELVQLGRRIADLYVTDVPWPEAAFEW